MADVVISDGNEGVRFSRSWADMGRFEVRCMEQWDWREPFSISESKNPLQVLKGLEKEKC